MIYLPIPGRKGDPRLFPGERAARPGCDGVGGTAQVGGAVRHGARVCDLHLPAFGRHLEKAPTEYDGR